MDWRSINDPFYGHSCSDGVMVLQEKTQLPHKWCHDGSWPLEVSSCGWGGWRSPKEVLGPTLRGLMTLQPLLGSWSSCMMMMTLYGPWHAMKPMNMFLVWWRSPWRLGIPNEDHDALAKVMEPTTCMAWWCGHEVLEMDLVYNDMMAHLVAYDQGFEDGKLLMIYCPIYDHGGGAYGRG